MQDPYRFIFTLNVATCFSNSPLKTRSKNFMKRMLYTSLVIVHWFKEKVRTCEVLGENKDLKKLKFIQNSIPSYGSHFLNYKTTNILITKWRN